MKNMENSNSKCINCGAVLVNNKCEYCGSDYTKNHGISGKIDGFEGYVTIGGKELHVYLSELEVTPETLEYRTYDGVLHRKLDSIHRRITLVEY